jgi:hypothetical protein
MNPTDSIAELRSEIELVYGQYCGLTRGLEAEAGLGGILVWIGELDAAGCRLVRAANIAGAASLSATADAAAQRLAIREGVIDFLVTSLSEALRILKNEIRKRNSVAVGVGLSPAQVASEMRERGVLPDLLRPGLPDAEVAELLALGARSVRPAAIPAGREFCIFADAPADFEARALAMIPESDHATRRWLRLSPRYLGPQMRRVRSLVCDGGSSDKLRAKS